MATKIFDNPKNDLEKDIADYVKPLLTEEVEENIAEKKLTLAGCLEYCFKKGKKFEVRSGNSGVARVSEEQHFKWVREYFGIKGDDAPKPKATAAEKPKAGAIDLDFDSLFD